MKCKYSAGHEQVTISYIVLYKTIGGIVGTLVFLVLRLIFGYNCVGDGQTLATLISLDTIALVLFLKLKNKA